jgi:hypothetical protein
MLQAVYLDKAHHCLDVTVDSLTTVYVPKNMRKREKKPSEFLFSFSYHSVNQNTHGFSLKIFEINTDKENIYFRTIMNIYFNME